MTTPTLVATYANGVNTATGATVAVTSVLAGDMLLAAVVGGYTNAANLSITDGTVPETTAWAAVGTDVGNTAASPAQNCGLAMRRRPCNGAGTYNINAGSSNETLLLVAHIRGQDSSPIDGVTTNVVGQDPSGAWNGQVQANAVSPTGTDDLLLGFFARVWFVGASTWTPPAGMTERQDASVPNAIVSAELATLALAASGSTGNKIATASPGTGQAMYGLASGLVAVKGAVATADTADMFLSSP